MPNLSKISEILSRRQSDEEDHYYRKCGGGRSWHGNYYHRKAQKVSD